MPADRNHIPIPKIPTSNKDSETTPIVEVEEEELIQIQSKSQKIGPVPIDDLLQATGTPRDTTPIPRMVSPEP